MEFMSKMENKHQPVTMQINAALAARVAQNRKKLQSILKTVIFCGRQNIPLRGHRDDSRHLSEDGNHGNFQALLEFRIDAGDKVLEEHFKNANKNATYRSKTTQNELIEVCGDHIRDKLLKEIKEAVFFSISADEAADAANIEQLTIVVRFVDKNDDIREEFMIFLSCKDGVDGETLTNQILEAIQGYLNLDMDNCRGQAYDGAGQMAGNVKGVSSRISQLYPKAIYTHCNYHVLNLCIVKGLSIREIQNMMELSDSVSRFFKFSPKRQASLEKFVDEEFVRNKTTKYKLKEMCRTRWVERHDAFEVFCQLFSVVVNCMEDMDKNEKGYWNRKTVSDARSLLKGIMDFHFLQH